MFGYAHIFINTSKVLSMTPQSQLVHRFKGAFLQDAQFEVK